MNLDPDPDPLQNADGGTTSPAIPVRHDQPPPDDPAPMITDNLGSEVAAAPEDHHDS